MSQESGGRRRPERRDLGVGRNSVYEASLTPFVGGLTFRTPARPARAAQASRGVG
ncbi:hypothetical protein PV379_15010 [Streptomyces caniscabiei]|uniref:hypothetical protein n=1 Tax=Streptomyces caniscabiei TaxID=2746961 RepID=UPI0029A46A42|nr:hypothetical protein [Streptomyces caniscabiei]MDX2598738.1 hypothetical protein [Streptomyces caniscabiei]MDX2736200.1 hypothetical protein [Streptomyces caniscabiei]MDX2778613.1 hypothetical protein [Streptomyces caniscabiei]